MAFTLNQKLTLSGRDPSVTLTIIVPTYNEAGNIVELVDRSESALMNVDFEIIVVDDSSSDGTANLAEGLGRKYGNVRVLRRPRKSGLASAVLDGLKVAEGDAVAVIDADLQHPPEILPKMLREIREGHKSMVIASRYVSDGGIIGWNTRRKIVSRGANLLARIALPKVKAIKDPLSGCFMFVPSIIEGVKLNPVGYKILLEMLVKGRCSSVTEVPYVFVPRKKGKSKLSTGEIWNYVRHLMGLFMSCVLTGRRT